MANEPLDLRTPPPPRPVPDGLPVASPREPLAAHNNAEHDQLLEWSALEYERKPHTTNWFLAFGAITLAFLLLSIIIKSYLFLALVSLSSLVILIYAKREPKEFSFAISPQGIRMGNRIYSRSTLVSFWIFNHSHIKELSIETSKPMSPFLRIPLGEMDPQKIKEMLILFLPEKKHKEFFTDQIAHKLGL